MTEVMKSDAERAIKGLEYCLSATVLDDCEHCPFQCGEAMEVEEQHGIPNELKDLILDLLRSPGQFPGAWTGLMDKHGERIYEGDIVQYQFDNDDDPWPNKRTEKILGVVFWSEWRASWSITLDQSESHGPLDVQAVKAPEKVHMNNDLYKYVRNGNRTEVIAHREAISKRNERQNNG